MDEATSPALRQAMLSGLRTENASASRPGAFTRQSASIPDFKIRSAPRSCSIRFHARSMIL
jgi:hypothetical protein